MDPIYFLAPGAWSYSTFEFKGRGLQDRVTSGLQRCVQRKGLCMCTLIVARI